MDFEFSKIKGGVSGAIAVLVFLASQFLINICDSIYQTSCDAQTLLFTDISWAIGFGVIAYIIWSLFQKKDETIVQGDMPMTQAAIPQPSQSAGAQNTPKSSEPAQPNF